MSAKKIITIFGATGNQGGSIVQKFLSDPELKDTWAVRGVTRDVSKDSSKKLAAQGAEVVAADLNDKATLVKAMQGSDTVYAVTNYWEKMDMKLEEQQGRNLADAAKEAGVKHFIWSSLLNVTKLSNGKLSRVYHFDSKANVEEYTRSLGIPATFLMLGYYMPNISGGNMSKQGDNWVLGLPIKADAAFPLADPVDTGKYIKAIVQNKDALLGKRFTASTEYLSPDGIVQAFKNVYPEAGKTATFAQLSKEQFYGIFEGKMPKHGIDEMYENMLLLQEPGYYGGLPLEDSLKYVTDKLTTFEDHARNAKVWAELK
ncbi:NmrA-like family protein [Xylariaceae sp. FL0255]|nr:NmrA-like family protein [Xylariaceae sp. FL0255]